MKEVGMRLGTKLWLGFIIVAILVLITGSFSYYLSNEIKNDLIVESQQTAEQLQILTEMTVQLQNSLLYTRNYLTETNKRREGDLSNTTASQIMQAEQITKQSLDDYYRALQSLKDIGDPAELENQDYNLHQDEIQTLTDSLETSFLFYNSLVRELYDLERDGAFGDEVFNVTIEPYFRNTLLPVLLQLRTHYNNSVDIQLAELQIRAEETVSRIVLITVLALIFSIILAVGIHRSISRPIQKLTAAATKFGRGDLSERIELSTKDELANLADSFNNMAENLSKSMVSRSYVNNIIQSMGDMLFVTDGDGNIELMNDMVITKLGFSQEEVLKIKVWDLMSPKETDYVRDLVKNERSDSSFVETMVVTKKGEVIPVLLSYSVLNEGLDQQPKNVFVASDISIQKEAEKKISDALSEKSVMLAEIHHRVKNNLAVISGLLELQIWNSEGDENVNILRDSQLRIQSIALVHEKLYQTENFASVNISEYVKELVEAIASSFQNPNKKIDVNFSFGEVHMNINQAIPFSLLLNESVVNVYKHAFKEKEEGTISIKLSRKDNEIVLNIIDDGVGVSDKQKSPESASLGMTIIETLTHQLEGEYSLSNGSQKGTVFELVFPVELPEPV